MTAEAMSGLNDLAKPVMEMSYMNCTKALLT